ncbi:MAG: hypothetical protein M1818_007115 [Claussenomyces sp. TS43310]|nr:MAG: hypothetical protein M1818_007115 [Claussenomyces sp. TS43310]
MAFVDFECVTRSYAKVSKDNIDKVAAPFQADPQKMEFLSILDGQVDLLTMEGRPDLSRFFDLLDSHSITSSKEVSTLRAEYGLERLSQCLVYRLDIYTNTTTGPVPQGCLDTALERVVEGIGNVLGKQKLGDDDSVMVNGAVELSCGVFHRLYSREWLNCCDIAAAREMTDRPVFVRLGLSIPLHKEDENGEVTPLSNPLRRWRKKIDDYSCKGKNDLEGPQVYICPLNVNANHFTLLKINEQTKITYHYDSLANLDRPSKDGANPPQEEFKYLGVRYTEAPTPQQRDRWTCGLMVICNAKGRMIGLLVGSWDDKVDPDRVTKGVVGDCQTFLKDDDLQPSPLFKKRKKMAEGVQKNVLNPSRSSRRRREITEGC